jgi:hypothetical protein
MQQFADDDDPWMNEADDASAKALADAETEPGTPW